MTTEGCTYTSLSTASAKTCTHFTYTDWSSCVNGTEHRSLISKSPEKCVGGNILLYRSCNQGSGTGSPAPAVYTTPNDPLIKPSITENQPGNAVEESALYTTSSKIAFRGSERNAKEGTVSLSIDGTIATSTSISEGGAWEMETPVSDDTDTHTYLFHYTDNSGTLYKEKTYTVTKDTEKPSFTGFYRFLIVRVGDMITWSAEDNVSVDHYTYTIGSLSGETTESSLAVADTLSRGFHILRVYAVDAAGNTTRKTGVVWVRGAK